MFLDSLRDYSSSFTIALLFGTLLIATAFLSFFPNIFLSSGSGFIDYTLIRDIGIIDFTLEAVLVLILLSFFAFFTTLIIIRTKTISQSKDVSTPLRDKIGKYFLRVFFFYAIYFGVLFSLGAMLVPLIPLLGNLVLFAVALLLLFVPQSIVLDEKKLFRSFSLSASFVKGNLPKVLVLILLGSLLLAIIPLIEILFDYAFFVGRYLTLIFSLVFIVPLLEIIKTKMYISKYDLMKPFI